MVTVTFETDVHTKVCAKGVYDTQAKTDETPLLRAAAAVATSELKKVMSGLQGRPKCRSCAF